MRAYDMARDRHPVLSFTSFDMQTAGVAAKHVLAYLHETAPEQEQAAKTAYAGLDKLDERSPQRPPADIATPIAQHAAKVIAVLDARHDALTAASSPQAWRDARQAALIVQQAARNTAKEGGPGYRDEMMAHNVSWLADHAHPDEKIVLWAHNAHVSFNAGSDFSFVNYKPMGSWLRQRFGQDMYVLGFAFAGGAIRAVAADGRRSGPKEHLVPRSPQGSGDSVLRAAELPMFFLDLRSVQKESVLGLWLVKPHLFRSAGALWPGQHPETMFAPVALPECYDGLIFIADSHQTRGLPFVRLPR
jgi:erythromycin esterase